MKTRLLTIALALSFITIVGGAYFLTSMGQEPVGAAIKFDPDYVEWDSIYPYYWLATIRSADGYDWNPRDIDPSTVLFEHMLPPVDGYYVPGGYVARFDGQAVFNILTSTIGHMGIPPDTNLNKKVQYYFTVSGNLMDGTPFEGEGTIKVRFVAGFPEPPLPPP